MDKDLADEIRQFRSPADNETRMFYEIVIAPSYTPDGLAHLKGKSKTLRILESQPRAPTGRSLRQISGNTIACDDGIIIELGLVAESLPGVWTTQLMTPELGLTGTMPADRPCKPAFAGHAISTYSDV